MKTNLIKVITLIAIMLCCLNLPAKSIGTKEMIKDAKNLIERADVIRSISLYKKAYTIFDTVSKMEQENKLALYYKAFIEYRFLTISMDKTNAGLYDIYIDSAIAHSKILTNSAGFESEGCTILAAIYMMKIAKSPMEAPILSGKITSQLDMAQKINPENPRLYIIRGIMKLKTPAFFGGSTEEAIENLKKSVSIFEKQENDTTLTISWGYLEALTWMGNALASINKFDEAEFFYRRALDIEPDYGWVKYVLLPDLEKKKANK